jgi:hypothetical protein
MALKGRRLVTALFAEFCRAPQLLPERYRRRVGDLPVEIGSEVVAKAGEPFVCSLSDPSNPTVVYDTSITLDDLTKPTQLDVEVASSPHP